MSDPSGQIEIDLHRGGRALRVAIRASRPVGAVRVFRGKTLTQVARQLPTLYSICATAQAFACTAACEQAAGLTPSPSVQALRGRLLQAETVKEHAWRLLLDWPVALGLEPEAAAMAAVMRRYRALRAHANGDVDPFSAGARARVGSHRIEDAALELASVVSDALFGDSPRRWLSQVADAATLAGWAAEAPAPAARLARVLGTAGLGSLGRNDIAALPALPLTALLDRLSARDADTFVAEPTWSSHPCETTPFARCRRRPLVASLAYRHGNGVLPRLAALLVESAEGLCALSGEAVPGPALAATAASAPGDCDGARVGIAVVEAARGSLVHCLEAVDARVQRYRIVAPTEWNFHPNGVVAAGLRGADFADSLDDEDLRRRAALFITAVDPCVAYRLSLS
jgi:hypothetical protein